MLNCQHREEGWDKGGFFPLEDQPEADHPTVDATCLAIMALCDFYANRRALQEKLQVQVDTESNGAGFSVSYAAAHGQLWDLPV